MYKKSKALIIILLAIACFLINTNYVMASSTPKPKYVKNMKYSGGLYTGYTLNNKPHGTGTYTYKSEDGGTRVISGNFRNGNPATYFKDTLCYKDGKDSCKVVEYIHANSKGYYHGEYRKESYVNNKLIYADTGIYSNGLKKWKLFT